MESHYHDILTGRKVDPLRIIVMRIAGTEKIYLIKAIRNQLRKMAGIEYKSPVLMLTLTGIAAYNINGMTIHSILSIPIIIKNLDINGERLNELQDRLQNVSYIIIDEKSMVGWQT